jgi:hypothetical protein
MVYTLAQINDLWTTKSSVLDKVYLCEDMYMYKGVQGGALTRVLTGNLDNYKAELRTQQLAVEQEEYTQSLVVAELVTKVAEIESPPKLKQVEVDFGTNSFQTYKIFNITDLDSTINSNIISTKVIKSPSDNRSIDEEFAETIDVSCMPKDGSIDIYVKSIIGSVSGRFIINYLIN